MMLVIAEAVFQCPPISWRVIELELYKEKNVGCSILSLILNDVNLNYETFNIS